MYVRKGEREGWVEMVDDDGNISGLPDDEREVMTFQNGYVKITDHEGRQGGAWGPRLGWFDHDRRAWRVGGSWSAHVTHWMEMPEPPETAR